MTTRTLDYGPNNPFTGVFGAPRSLAWPVNAYRVTIPSATGAGGAQLNPFETVILKCIAAAGSLDEKALAEETCIPVDLVRNVVLRMRDKGLIDDPNAVDEHQWDTRGSDPSKEAYTSAFAFRELVGGKMLPFVHVFDEKNPVKTKVIDRAYTLTEQRDARRLEAPSARDIIDVLVRMRRRTAAHARDMRIPAIAQLRVEPEPERYLLDCPIAIQAHDAEPRIADPFGIGFSRELEGVFAQRLASDEALQRWMTKWRENLSSPKQPNTDQQGRIQPFDTQENRRRYPGLLRALTPARGSEQRTLEDIYASLEWALFYVCQAHAPELAMQRLRQVTGPNYSAWLSSVAHGIGFESPNYGFRPLPEGKLLDYTAHKPEMETVLAIALLQAETDPQHPLHTLAALHPEFIVRIRALRSDRGERAHGAHVTLATGSRLTSDPFMQGTISTLLPSVRFDATAAPAPARSDSQADLRLDARNSLEAALGYGAFNRLGPSAKASLIEAEQFWLLARDGDDARNFVGRLYAALQGVLRELPTGPAPIGVRGGDYIRQAAANAVRTGLGPLPQGLTSVKPDRIRAELEGGDTTLGASALALLLTADDQTLNELAAGQPDFLAFVADISAKRGHGNQPIPLQREAAGRLRKGTFAALGTLLELAQGSR